MKLIRKRLSYCRGLVGNTIYMFTANSVIKHDGKLVIGVGCAKLVRDYYKNIDKQFGKEIEHLSVFNLRFVPWKEQWIGAFQTKVDWQDSSPIDVVQGSIDQLLHVTIRRPNHTFHLPCPAVNHGGKSEKEILPLLEKLPDNVIVYLD